MKVKRFVLMTGHTYYASGGFHDYSNSFDTKEEAEKAMSDWDAEHPNYTWSHIVDLEEGTISGQGEGCNPMKLFQS